MKIVWPFAVVVVCGTLIDKYWSHVTSDTDVQVTQAFPKFGKKFSSCRKLQSCRARHEGDEKLLSHSTGSRVCIWSNRTRLTHRTWAWAWTRTLHYGYSPWSIDPWRFCSSASSLPPCSWESAHLALQRIIILCNLVTPNHWSWTPCFAILFVLCHLDLKEPRRRSHQNFTQFCLIVKIEHRRRSNPSHCHMYFSFKYSSSLFGALAPRNWLRAGNISSSTSITPNPCMPLPWHAHRQIEIFGMASLYPALAFRIRNDTSGWPASMNVILHSLRLD